MKVTKKQLRQIIREALTGRRHRLTEGKFDSYVKDVVALMRGYRKAVDAGELGEENWLDDFLDTVPGQFTKAVKWLDDLDHENYREITNDVADRRGPAALSPSEIKSYVQERWGDEIRAWAKANSKPVSRRARPKKKGKPETPRDLASWQNASPATKKSVIDFCADYITRIRGSFEMAPEPEGQLRTLFSDIVSHVSGFWHDPKPPKWSPAEEKKAAPALEWLRRIGSNNVRFLGTLLDNAVDTSGDAIEDLIVRTVSR